MKAVDHLGYLQMKTLDKICTTPFAIYAVCNTPWVHHYGTLPVYDQTNTCQKDNVLMLIVYISHKIYLDTDQKHQNLEQIFTSKESSTRGTSELQPCSPCSHSSSGCSWPLLALRM